MTMSHLDEQLLLQQYFDQSALTPGDLEHLASCVQCRHAVAEIESLGESLALARMAQPTEGQIAAYAALFEHVQSRNSIQRAMDWVRATLTLDTRLQPTPVGVRGVATGYRLLYSTRAVDIELAVDPQNGTRQVEGELLPLGEDDLSLPALVHLDSQADDYTAEVESTRRGRFTFRSVPPGRYQMTVSFPDQGDIVLDEVEIA
jgi:hypothetical protein